MATTTINAAAFTTTAARWVVESGGLRGARWSAFCASLAEAGAAYITPDAEILPISHATEDEANAALRAAKAEFVRLNEEDDESWVPQLRVRLVEGLVTISPEAHARLEREWDRWFAAESRRKARLRRCDDDGDEADEHEQDRMEVEAGEAARSSNLHGFGGE